MNDIHAEMNSQIRAYLAVRAAGLPPLNSVRATIANSLPKWRADRVAHIVSVFMMFSERHQAALRTERDLVMLMLACLSMSNHPSPPGSPNRIRISKIMIQLLNEYRPFLKHPIEPDAKSPDNFPTRIFRAYISLIRHVHAIWRRFRRRLR